MSSDKGKILKYAGGSTQSVSSRNVLLARHSHLKLSDIFEVKHNPVRLVAFGLPPTSIIKVHRVWFPDNHLDLSDCGELLAGQPLEMPLKYNATAVILTSQQPEIVIDMTGVYRVEFQGEDEDREMVHVIKIKEDVMRVTDIARLGVMDNS